MHNIILRVRVFLIASIIGVLSSTTVFASTLKTVTLSVDKMTCSICPITVKRALRQLDGVTAVVAKYEGAGDGWAKVTYDPDKVDVDDLTFTTEEAGYPSRIQAKKE